MEYGGVLLGANTSYDIVGITGLDDLPDVRTSDIPRPSDHGLYPGPDFAAGRIIEVEVEVTGATEAAFRANVEALAAATILRSDETALVFRLPAFTGDRQIFARPRRRAIPTDMGYVLQVGRAVLQFAAADPRVYAATLATLSVTAATSGGGRTYNRTYNLTYAAGGTGGTLMATNAGNFPTRPILTVTGPSDTPRIENVTAGKALEVGLSLAAGEFLVIDTDERTVMLGGTSSRYSSLTAASRWWELAPGDNSLKFTSASNVGTLQVSYRSAWL